MKTDVKAELSLGEMGEMIKGGFYSEVKVLFSFLTASNDYMNLFTSQSQEAIHLCSFTLK